MSVSLQVGAIAALLLTLLSDIVPRPPRPGEPVEAPRPIHRTIIPADLEQIAVPKADSRVAERLRTKQEAGRHLREAMLKKINFEVRDQSLRAAAENLGKQLDLNLIFAEQDLVDAGVDIDYEIDDFSVKGLSAEMIFRLLLEPSGLEITLDGEVAKVTTSELAEEILETRVYSVEDLTWRVLADGRAVHDFNPIISIVQQSTHGPWFDLDGTGGTIRVCETGGVHALVIRQNWKQHEEIAELLQRMRDARVHRPGDADSPRRQAR